MISIGTEQGVLDAMGPVGVVGGNAISLGERLKGMRVGLNERHKTRPKALGLGEHAPEVGLHGSIAGLTHGKVPRHLAKRHSKRPGKRRSSATTRRRHLSSKLRSKRLATQIGKLIPQQSNPFGRNMHQAPGNPSPH